MLATMPINKMNKLEKLEAMEYLWKDLCHEKSSIQSPVWHEEVLKDTEKRFNSGIEQPVDWSIAKQKLRNSFE